MAKKSSRQMRRSVHKRIRKKIAGTADRPRLAVFRSLNHIYAQIIDDSKGETVAAASTAEPEFRTRNGSNIAAAKEIGKLIAERAKARGITIVVFDRGGYIYHGRVKGLAEAAREAGLQF